MASINAAKVIKVTLLAGVTIAVIGTFVGPQQTADVVPVAVDRTFWGVGVGASGLKYAGPGLQRGFNQGSAPSTFNGLANDLGTKAGKDTVAKLCATTPKPTGCA